MLDFLKKEYVLEGKAFDINALFRISGELVEYAVTDMAQQGYMPISIYPEVDWTDHDDKTISYIYKWRLKKFEF